MCTCIYCFVLFVLCFCVVSVMYILLIFLSVFVWGLLPPGENSMAVSSSGGDDDDDDDNNDNNNNNNNNNRRQLRTTFSLYDFRLPPWCKWLLRSFGILHNIEWLFIATFRHSLSVSSSRVKQSALPLWMGQICCLETSVRNCHSLLRKSQKRAELNIFYARK